MAMDWADQKVQTWPGCVNKRCTLHERVSAHSQRRRLGLSLPRRCRDDAIAVAVAVDAHRRWNRWNHTTSEEQSARQYREQVCNEQRSRSGSNVTIWCTTSLGRWLPPTHQEPGSSASKSSLNSAIAATPTTNAETNCLTVTETFFHPQGADLPCIVHRNSSPSELFLTPTEQP